MVKEFNDFSFEGKKGDKKISKNTIWISPSGRPKHGISTIYNKWLKKKRNRAKIEEFLDATIDADAKSRMAGVLQLERMADRTEGSVTQQLDMNVTGTIQLADTIEQRRKKRSDSKS